ncbi:hypothetical protein LEMLEM_LOCUS205, partial [Lemmus lemmus]
ALTPWLPRPLLLLQGLLSRSRRGKKAPDNPKFSERTSSSPCVLASKCWKCK